MMRLLRVRLTIRRAMVLVAAAAVFFAVSTRFGRIIEELDSPVAVAGWTEAGLFLRDGRRISLPGIRALPKTSAALTEATRCGVELNENGCVYGLVRVHHWCGNDAVREHIARVNLSYLLMFVGEGQTERAIPPELQSRAASTVGGRFTAWGWEIGEYYQFRGWCWHADELGVASATAAGARAAPASAHE